MKAIVLDRAGTYENLRYAEMPKPEPGTGEARVRVRAVGLNPADYKHIQTAMPHWRLPLVTGCDLAGTIDSVGPDVDLPQGLRVLVKTPLARLGAYAEYAIVPAFLVIPLPDNVGFGAAAALPTAGITAYQAINRRLRVKPGDWVLVQGGAGGVGGFAIQFAAKAGATVVATASGPNLPYLRQLGAHHAIDYRTEDIARRSAEITGGRGYDAIVDAAGPATAAAGLALLTYGGAMACIAGRPEPADFARMQRGTSLHDIAVDFPFRTGDRKAQEDLPAMGREMVAMLARGDLDPMIVETIRLEDIPKALARLAGRHVRGKIVAEIDG